jgi:hypothetical protein
MEPVIWRLQRLTRAVLAKIRGVRDLGVQIDSVRYLKVFVLRYFHVLTASAVVRMLDRSSRLGLGPTRGCLGRPVSSSVRSASARRLLDRPVSKS